MEFWFQDEARSGQQATIPRVWARRGTRPRAPRDRRYTWAWLFGAACPARGVGAALVLPEVNAEATGLHLAEIGQIGRQSCRDRVKISVVAASLKKRSNHACEFRAGSHQPASFST